MTTQTEKNLLLSLDLYKLIEVEDTSTPEQIKKAYRKRALQLHPDKNPGNKEASEKFVQLQRALEILSDKAARAAYDAVRRQKREKAKRDEQMDEKRRKQKQDLEMREKKAQDKVNERLDEIRKTKEEDNLQKEIDRLRNESSKLIEQEMEFLNEQIRLEKKKANESEATKISSASPASQQLNATARIKISWPKSCADQLREDLLRHLFEKYGEIEVLVVSKKTSAIIEYKKYSDGIDCLNDESNLNDKYSISLKWLGEQKAYVQELKDNPEVATQAKVSDQDIEQFNVNNFEDYEAEILKKLKAAQS